MSVLYTNNAKTTLSASLNNSATSLSVASSSGFPSLSGNHYFYATLDDNTNLEVVKVTAVSGTTWTVVRGQDNTSATAFSSGDTVELRLNAALLTDVVNDALASSFTRQDFTGNGSTTAFTLNKTPGSENDLIVFIEGVFQNQADYTLSGTTLTFDEAPASSRKIVVYHVSASVSGDSLALNTFSGDGSTTAFTMSVDPLYENNTMVFIDGVYQNKSTYSTSGTTLTFDAAPANGTAIDVTTHTQATVNVPVDGSVSTAKLAADAVTGAKIADDAIDSEHYTDGSIDTAHIGNLQVTTGKLAADAVTAAKLADDAVVTANITDDAVTTAKVADDQITLAKLAGLARGKIIYGDASGNPAALALGSNGQVLKSDGTDIVWGTDSSGVALDDISTGDAASTLATSSGDITLDSPADISLDADGEQIRFKDGGTEIGHIDMGSQNLTIRSSVNNKDIELHGTSGTANIVALKLDMSDSGSAFFNADVYVDKYFRLRTTDDQANQWLLYTHTNDNLEINYNGSGNAEVVVDTSGNVGIGTTSPSTLLHLGGTAPGDSIIRQDSTSSGTNWEIGERAAGKWQIFEDDNDSIVATFMSTGNVGIGETSPAAPLHVEHSSATAYNGAAEITESLIVSNKNGTDDSGVNNVASIGLHVADGATSQGFINYVRTGNNTGKFTFSHRKASTTYTEDFVITDAGTYGMGSGSGSLAGSIIINNDGGTGTINNAYYNTVLGWEAADDLTSGDSNTIVGNQAGYKLTEATGNTLIGRLAGEQLTTGSYNTAIGFNTMGDATVTGASNTAVGNSVMVAVTSGAGNTAMGEACAAALTTGSNNVAIGRSAMSNAAVTGNYNVAIGYEAMRAVTSGSENVMIGRDAGHDITTGTQSVSVGHESLTKNQTGQGNAGVGFQALEATTGGENIAMGWKAGEANEGGVYNVFLGSMTRGTHPSHSQAIAIGRNIDAAPGQVAIGTSGLGKVYNEFDTDNAWSQGSDERLKQDIKDSTLGLDFINDLRPVTYRWKPSNELPETFPMYDEENQRNTDIVMTGLIAQEVKTAIDTSGVERFGGWGEDNDGIQQIKKELFVFPLINAVKELTAKLEAAEARIKTLEDA